MPSLTYKREVTTTVVQLFGYSKGRTAWTIYNTDTTNSIYWGSQRGGSSSMFEIPKQTAFTAKIPEDDPSQEIWVLGDATIDIYVYEGFAE